MDQLKEEIEYLKKTIDNRWVEATDVQKRTLVYDEDLLRHAEFEVIERTLLK